MGKPVLTAALINIGLARSRRFSFVFCLLFCVSGLRLAADKGRAFLMSGNDEEICCECARLRSVFLSFF